jgi:hypothetical protein
MSAFGHCQKVTDATNRIYWCRLFARANTSLRSKGACGKFGKLGTSYRFWFSATFWASGGSALFVFPQSASHTPVVCPLTNTAEDALLGPGGGRRGFFSSAGLWQMTVRIIPILAVVIAIGLHWLMARQPA